jgi:hypothetical protein
LVCTALTAPAERLQAALLEERVPFERFWSHVVPLAADIGAIRELTELCLTKTVGSQEAAPRMRRFRDLLADLKDAFSAALPRLNEDLASRIEPLRSRWNYEGDGLLGRIANWTEPGILVETAAVVLVYPALGGGGVAHLPYNLGHIEAVLVDPMAELPEVVRLAWLLSMLNLDLPRYSEGIPPSRLATVAGLAMIPITLAAAAEVQLARCDEESIGLAVQAWNGSLDNAQAQTATLLQWWETYRTMRPAWPTALHALYRLLD